MRNDEEIKHCLMFISLPIPSIVAYGFVLFVNNCAIYPFLILHLSMAIQGPEHLHQGICKFHLPRANILPQKATTVPPPGSIIWNDSQIVT